MAFTGNIGSDWTGQYSRWLYNEENNYLLVAKMRLDPTTMAGLPLLDVELNEQAEIILQLIRRVVQRIFGNGSVGNGFKIGESGMSTVNNFNVLGGGGTTDTAGSIFVEGWMPFVSSGFDYTSQSGVSALTTPSIDRTDEVYIDVYYDEITKADDTNLIDPVSTLETSRRVALVWKVKVAEGSTTPAAYVDANNVRHWTMKLATLNRLASVPNILTAMITDCRNDNRFLALMSDVTTHAALTAPHSATATPTINRIAMYDAAGRLKTGAAASASNDCVRKAELDALSSSVTTHAALTAPHSATTLSTPNRIPLRNEEGDIITRVFRTTYGSTEQCPYFMGLRGLGSTENHILPMTIVQAIDALGFSKTLLAETGVQILPGGLTLQWGVVGAVSANSYRSVSFQLTFPSAVLAVIPIAGATSAGKPSLNVENINTSQFKAWNTSTTAATLPGFFIAIGI